MTINLVTGGDGAQLLPGSGSADLIYGFDPAGSQVNTSSIAAQRITGSLTQPVYVTAPRADPERLFVVEKTGAIKIVDISAADAGIYTVRPAPFIDLAQQIDTFSERGLLGLAFDPAYDENRFFYVTLINKAGNTEIRRYQASATSPDLADASTAQIVLTIQQPAGAGEHKAGWLDFGPDGYLYVAVGDGTNSAASQDINNLLGKILRIDVHADAFPTDPLLNYAIPASNPFVGVAGADEIFALGVRNPWRDSFDRATGEFFIADVGGALYEEVNKGSSGANYGWRPSEGPDGLTPAYTAPIFYYPHDGNQSVTGGYVYRGQSDFLHGQYFYGDFSDSIIATLRDSGGVWSSTDRSSQIVPSAGVIVRPASFGEDARGDLYVVEFNGALFRLTPSGVSADGADIITAGGGDDQVFAGAGDDRVLGDAGHDVIAGMSGNDTLAGGAGLDRLDGGAGNDTLDGDADADWLSGGAGNDVARGGDGNDTLFGGIGADQLTGGAGNDLTVGGLGDDWHFVDAMGDRVVERAGEGTLDRVFAQASFTLTPAAEIEIFSTDYHAGTATIDLTGNERDNLIYGNAGTNVLSGMSGNDRLMASAGADTLLGADGNDILYGGDGADSLSGGANDDQLYGEAGADQMTGGTGSDWFIVDDSGDIVEDGSGEGTLDRVFTSVSYTLTANAEIEIFSTTYHSGVTALDLTGNALANTILGNAGANVIDGRDGNDTLWGYGGSDRFLFDTPLNAATNVDRIRDFDPADDTLLLDDMIFTALAPGALPAAAFGAGSEPQNANQHILYDSATGAVYYDDDGVAGGAACFATVAAGLTLTAADFVVV